MELPDVYKIHLKTAAEDSAELIGYCLEHSVIGVGWGAHYFLDAGDPTPTSFEDYLKGASDIWPSRQLGPVRWLHDAAIGSLVWFRDLRGNYYLARITEDWQLLTGSEAERIDLGNIRQVEYWLVGSPAEVPGAVLRGYSAPRQWAFNAVTDYGAQVYTALLASELFGEAAPNIPMSTRDVLDSLLGPLDVEDLVAAYLQDTLNYVARNSKTTAAYEYVLKSRKDGHHAVVQVKTGDALVPIDTLDQQTADKWFVYVAAEQDLPAWVHQITPDALTAYMDSRPAALPPVVERWITRRT